MNVVQHYREIDTLDLRQCYSLTDKDLGAIKDKKLRAAYSDEFDN